MDAGSHHGLVAKELAIGVEVTGSSLVSYLFPFLPLSLPCVIV